MTDIYEQHRKAFSQVAAYVILDAKTGKRVATVAIKFPKDGARRLWAYLHWFGSKMVRGHAGGYGYDRSSAAMHVAASKMVLVHHDLTERERQLELIEALRADDGRYWDYRLREAEFEVLQAV